MSLIGGSGRCEGIIAASEAAVTLSSLQTHDSRVRTMLGGCFARLDAIQRNEEMNNNSKPSR